MGKNSPFGPLTLNPRALFQDRFDLALLKAMGAGPNFLGRDFFLGEFFNIPGYKNKSPELKRRKLNPTGSREIIPSGKLTLSKAARLQLTVLYFTFKKISISI
jgi:hypothetical protein